MKKIHDQEPKTIYTEKYVGNEIRRNVSKMLIVLKIQNNFNRHNLERTTNICTK